MSFTCVLLITAYVFTGVQAGLVTHVYKQYKTRQGRRQNYWENTEPRAIPSYMIMSEGSYYTAGRIKERSYGGDYYRSQDKCDDMGDECWGFQTTFGCTDRLGCGQFLILEDPGRARKIKLKGTRVYSKKTQTWDAVPLQCMGLNEDPDADTVGECEENCSQDLECEIYQWYDDNTCWRGKSNTCHGDKVVVEGYRARPVFWAFTPTECDGLKYDSTADDNIEQCQYNCQWDMTCDMYQYKRGGKCYRGQGEDCGSLVSPMILDSGKRDEKFKWKRIRKDCSGLNRDQDAATADECKQNCADSQHCSIWQFKANGQCWRGHSTQCSPDRDLTVEDGGYRWYINNGDSEEDNTDDDQGASLLVTNDYPGEYNEQGAYFGFENDAADTFFGTTEWDGRKYSVIQNGEKTGEVIVWRDNANCQMSCGRWNPLANRVAGDWSEGDKLTFADDYRIAPEGETCPDEQIITSESECRVLAEETSGFSWDGERSWDDRPYGCVITVDDNEVNFNSDKQGTPSNDEQRALCSQPDLSTPDFSEYQIAQEGQSCLDVNTITSRMQCIQMAESHSELEFDSTVNLDNRPGGCLITTDQNALTDDGDKLVFWNQYADVSQSSKVEQKALCFNYTPEPEEPESSTPGIISIGRRLLQLRRH